MQRDSRKSIGRWSIHHPWRALAAWIAFVLACLALGAISGTKTLDNGAVGESARGYAIMNTHRLWAPGRELAYLHNARGPVPRSAIRDVERRFRALGLTPELKRSADRQATVIAVELTGDVDVERIRAAVADAASAHPQLTIEETGDVSTDQARNRTVDRDLHRAELLSIPVTLLLLVFAFGSLVAALIPVLLALSAVAAGLGLLGPLSQLFPVEDSAKTVVLLIGMAVGVDYALFFVVRSRAERNQALETTLRTSGRTVVISGATVAIAMAGMYLVGVRALSGIATAAIAVIACAVLAAVTALPATLRLLGPWVDSGRPPVPPRAHTDSAGRFWSALVERVTRRPLVAAALSIGMLVALAYPALSLHISEPSDLALTAQSEPALKALADVRRAFPSAADTGWQVLPRAVGGAAGMSRAPYRGRHEATRRALLADAAGRPCVLCGQPMLPGQDLDLDHAPDGSGYRGMAHATCNRADGGRRGSRRQRQRRRLAMDLIGVGVLAVEVAADRGHTSIASACRLPDDRVQVELVAYLAGTATAVDRVAEFCGRWKVDGVVVDPMGGATNLRRPLRERRVKLAEPDAAAVKTAHADFLDLAHRRELAVVANEVLSTAMQHLTERQLGGQPVFDRRGALVDVAPAVAAELALWGLLSRNRPKPMIVVSGR